MIDRKNVTCRHRLVNAHLCRVLVGLGGVLAACSPPRSLDDATPAERGRFLHSATYVEAIAFLRGLEQRVHAGDAPTPRDSTQATQAPMVVLSTGSTKQGRQIPVVVLARPMVQNGAQAHTSGRAVIYVEASMAAGEVNATDGMLALTRDLVLENAPGGSSVLDSVVVVIVPVANPDGNASRGPVAKNRPDQRGPDTVGTDLNAEGLTLNRDFVKTETSETRNTLDLFRAWDPDVYVELHTADGSFTGFAYNYAPTLHPASLIVAPYTSDSMLPEIRRRLRDRHSLESFDYGTLVPPRGPGPDTATARRWETFDYRARYGTNYVGLRNRIAILGVSYAHDPFERRIVAQEAFVREILSVVAKRGPQIRALVSMADSSVKRWAVEPAGAPPLALAARVAEGSPRQTIQAEDLIFTGDSTITQNGVPRGVQRTGHLTSLELPVWNLFKATRTGQLPRAWLLPPGDSAIANRLALHGIESTRLDNKRQHASIEYFVPDSIVRETEAFQGHHLEHVYGHWRTVKDTALTAGSYLVMAGQPLGVLALELLDPESADGFVTWNLFDADPQFRPGGRFPVARIQGAAGSTLLPTAAQGGSP